MKTFDLTLKGVTVGWASGTYNQLFVTVAVCSCVMHNENDAKWKFPVPPIVKVSIEPFRHLPIDDKHALITNGSEVELHVTGTLDELQAEVISVVERADRPLKDFLVSLSQKKQD